MRTEIAEELVLAIKTDHEIRYLNSLAHSIIQSALPSVIVNLNKPKDDLKITIDEKSQKKIDAINKQIQYRIDSLKEYYKKII